MKFFHMPKEVNGLSNLVLSHWFSKGKNYHVDVDMKIGQ